MKASSIFAALLFFTGFAHAADALSFPAAGLNSISAETESGGILAAGGARKDVSVEVVDNDPAKCVITAKAEGSKLVLRAEGIRLPVKKSWKNVFGFVKDQGEKLECRASFKIQSPSSLQLALETAAGSVDVQSYTSDVKIQNAAGDVTIHGLSGAVAVESAAGAITGSACAKSLKLDNAAGAIKLAGLCGPVAAEISAGNIDLEWEKVPASGQVRVQSAAGNVRLAFPVDAKITATLASPAGKITNEFAAAGGYPVKVETAAGNITLARTQSK